MNRYLYFYSLVVLALASTNALAQEEHGHFDIFIGITGTQTAYGGIDVDHGDVTLNQRVFEAEMGENPLDDVFFADEPGFNHPENDAALPGGVASLQAGDEIFVRKLPMSVDGNTADLFFWNGIGAASFVPAASVDFNIITPLADQSIGTAGAGGGFDDHPEFELSAGSSLPTPGIYLGSFEAQVGQLDPTDSLFLVMGTEGLITADFLGVSQMDFDLLTDDELDESLEGVIEVAVEYVEARIVPEPSTALLLMVVGLGLSQGRITRRS